MAPQTVDTEHILTAHYQKIWGRTAWPIFTYCIWNICTLYYAEPDNPARQAPLRLAEKGQRRSLFGNPIIFQYPVLASAAGR